MLSADDLVSYFPEKTEAIRKQCHNPPHHRLLLPVPSLSCDYEQSSPSPSSLPVHGSLPHHLLQWASPLLLNYKQYALTSPIISNTLPSPHVPLQLLPYFSLPFLAKSLKTMYSHYLHLFPFLEHTVIPPTDGIKVTSTLVNTTVNAQSWS